MEIDYDNFQVELEFRDIEEAAAFEVISKRTESEHYKINLPKLQSVTQKLTTQAQMIFVTINRSWHILQSLFQK